MSDGKRKLTLDRPATYQIMVPGHLDERWTSWDENIAITFVYDVDGLAATTLIGTFDQAALHGLLRRLYSFGMPLISVNWVEW